MPEKENTLIQRPVKYNLKSINDEHLTNRCKFQQFNYPTYFWQMCIYAIIVVFATKAVETNVFDYFVLLTLRRRKSINY